MEPRNRLRTRTSRVVRKATIALSIAAALWTVVHRRADAVGSWRPSTLPRRRIGAVSCRVGGTGPSNVLLLHGLVATGDVFGRTADQLAAFRSVAVPDLLGFGRSLDEDRDDFGTTAHLAALDAVVAEAAGDERLLIAAHSMGSTLAMRWACLHPDRVERVVCLGPPIWPSRTAARAAIGHANPMARAFVLDERLARRACALSCRHRRMSGWLAAMIAPRWPLAVATQASRHTWPAYHQAMEQQILDVDWQDLLEQLDRAGVPVLLIWGDRDPVGDREFTLEITRDLASVKVGIVPGADHSLPASHPQLIVEVSNPASTVERRG